jgi:hypothetical protein
MNTMQNTDGGLGGYYSSHNSERSWQTQREVIACSKYLENEHLTVLNEIFTKGKHLALFVDRSGVYSSLADIPAATKTAYNTL